MKIQDCRKQKNTLTFNHREWGVSAELYEGNMTLTVHYDGELEGRITLESNEVKPFAEVIKSFFSEGRRGIEFDSMTKDSIVPGIPMLQMSVTNWGEPFSEGIRFTVSENFNDYMLDNLYFDLEASDAEALANFILNQN